jgi:hypothetical protein
MDVLSKDDRSWFGMSSGTTNGSKEPIPVTGQDPICPPSDSGATWETQQPEEQPAPWQVRDKREKSLKAIPHVPRGPDQEGHVRTSRPVLVSKRLPGFVALVGNETNVRPSGSDTGPFKPVLCRDAQPTFTIVDQQS